MTNENRHRLNKICWAGLNNDCCGKLTKEHVVSKSVLNILPLLSARQEGKKPKPLGVSSYVLSRLCEHHNNSLSIYDAEACKLYKYMDSIRKVLVSGLPPKDKKMTYVYEINRWNLERWFAKTFMNMVLFNTTVFKPDNLPLYVTPHSIIDQLYNGKIFSPPFGLYVIDNQKPLLPGESTGFRIFQSENANIIRALSGVRSENYDIPQYLYINIIGLEIVGLFNLTPLQDVQAIDSALKSAIELLSNRSIYNFENLNFKVIWEKESEEYNAKIIFK